MFVTKRKLKKMKTEMMVVAGTGVATGVAGVTIGTVALVKESKTKKEVDERLNNIERAVAATEQSCTKALRVLVPMQDALLNAGIVTR